MRRTNKAWSDSEWHRDWHWSNRPIIVVTAVAGRAGGASLQVTVWPPLPWDADPGTQRRVPPGQVHPRPSGVQVGTGSLPASSAARQFEGPGAAEAAAASSASAAGLPLAVAGCGALSESLPVPSHDRRDCGCRRSRPATRDAPSQLVRLWPFNVCPKPELNLNLKLARAP